ncbi:MAG: DinB family protein [Candidatus Zixiibacteriota bacterium]
MMTKETLMGMLDYFDKVQKVTLKAIKMIPEDKLDFKPTPEMMSVKELIHHMFANERVAAQGAKKGSITEEDYKKEGEREFKNLQDLINYAEEVHEEANQIAGSLTDEDMKKKVENFFGMEYYPFLCFSDNCDHHWHHRGQLYVYLRLMGIKPPFLYDYKE